MSKMAAAIAKAKQAKQWMQDNSNPEAAAAAKANATRAQIGARPDPHRWQEFIKNREVHGRRVK
jgi:hypothetical protein